MEAASLTRPSEVPFPPASSTRLEPVARSWNPMVWLAMAVYKSGVGSTTPVRVMFARAPRLIFAHIVLMMAYAYGTSLSHRLRSLISVFGSRVNGCMFCDDLETRMAIMQKALVREDVDALPDYLTSDRFTPRERAVLRYIEELNTTKRASDETFHALKAHCSEREIVEITWINAVGNYLNLQAKPLGLTAEGTCEIPPRSARVA